MRTEAPGEAALPGSGSPLWWNHQFSKAREEVESIPADAARRTACARAQPLQARARETAGARTSSAVQAVHRLGQRVGATRSAALTTVP